MPNFTCIPLKLYSTEAVFHWSCIPLKLYSAEAVFTPGQVFFIHKPISWWIPHKNDLTQVPNAQAPIKHPCCCLSAFSLVRMLENWWNWITIVLRLFPDTGFLQMALGGPVSSPNDYLWSRASINWAKLDSVWTRLTIEGNWTPALCNFGSQYLSGIVSSTWPASDVSTLLRKAGVHMFVSGDDTEARGSLNGAGASLNRSALVRTII